MTSSRDRLLAALVALAALLAFANSLRGAFVYDDRKQILENHLIQEPALLGRAVTSDVWAFKGDRDEAWSNYWRPGFVLALAAQYAAFGADSPLPWHAVSLLLHALASVLAFAWLRRLQLGSTAAAAAALLFAVHPAHVESVAWIAGQPDLLATVFLLTTLLALPRLLLALPLYALALSCKELAVLFPALVFAQHWLQDANNDPSSGGSGEALEPGGEGERRRVAARPAPAPDELPERAEGALPTGRRFARAARAALPFAALALLFLVARQAVVGRTSIDVPWALSPLELALTAPSLLAFYLRQTLLPLWLGPSYPLRAVTLDNLGLANFALPLLALTATALVVLLATRREPRGRLLALLFALPLLPALYVNAFIQEQLVHDRYLYLPLLGALGLLALLAERALAPHGRISRQTIGLAGLALVALALAQTTRYNRAWGSELALWTWAVETDPSSAFNHAQLGHALLEAGRNAEAKTALERALAIRPVTTALLDRAQLHRREGKLDAARADLELVLAAQPDNPFAVEGLAQLFTQSGRLDEAAALLARGRDAIPYRACSMSSNRGVVLYLAGRKDEALAELEAAQPLVGSERTAACARAAFHLGSLYRELGRGEDARRAFRRFLTATERASDAGTLSLRRQAEASLSAAP